MAEKFIIQVLKEKPQKFTCLDMTFKNDDQLKTNTALQMPAFEYRYRRNSTKIEFKMI
jgi:hypothetical protein